MRLFEWIFVAISDFDIWDRNTRRRRRDDPVIAQWRLAQRRAGFALLAWLAAIAIASIWALLGPSAQAHPMSVTTLVQWADRALLAFVIFTTVLTAVRCYQAWRFEPSWLD